MICGVLLSVVVTVKFLSLISSIVKKKRQNLSRMMQLNVMEMLVIYQKLIFLLNLMDFLPQ
nr:MAG TPA: hypothetical protein [Caudoviricetes sp.]